MTKNIRRMEIMCQAIDKRISVIKGDITKLEVDAIVNAANSSLLGGGGVDGAIHKAGGREILEECIKIRNKQGGCAIGEAVITNAGYLKAKFVIHTVGPVWNEGTKGEVELLDRCYKNSFQLAHEHNVKSIAYPCISTGIYRFPKDIAAKVAVNKIISLLLEHTSIEKVIFVCFDDANYLEYKKYI
ncbi:O-acetyl-ADP-ribose deacetylase [Ruminiclostridium papyrosolvens DSM 2782]|nr:O-acetyl-ADP-ribose deacetylase [Ruminiclostridium papyrosolvens]WES32934.1 O-acetyl-ADP-ribose deacetylase [Ruminiclostridium papyrosolvens DSM 2782]